ncbi:MAG: hypothetical protein K9M97_12725 [Akkermansiaceae bacterium]|nr:hypothetical protein [Akkermansiaceae bacterium]
MKTRILLTALCAGWLAAPAYAAYGPPVLETSTEFFAYGDFWGTGRRSYVVIDRASGGMGPPIPIPPETCTCWTPAPPA